MIINYPSKIRSTTPKPVYMVMTWAITIQLQAKEWRRNIHPLSTLLTCLSFLRLNRRIFCPWAILGLFYSSWTFCSMGCHLVHLGSLQWWGRIIDIHTQEKYGDQLALASKHKRWFENDNWFVNTIGLVSASIPSLKIGWSLSIRRSLNFFSYACWRSCCLGRWTCRPVQFFVVCVTHDSDFTLPNNFNLQLISCFFLLDTRLRRVNADVRNGNEFRVINPIRHHMWHVLSFWIWSCSEFETGQVKCDLVESWFIVRMFLHTVIFKTSALDSEAAVLLYKLHIWTYARNTQCVIVSLSQNWLCRTLILVHVILPF
jgi:hypothetical protein